MLTREAAKQWVLERVKERHDPAALIHDDRTIERPFGWLFVLTAPDADAPKKASHRLIIVNKQVGQIVATSIDYTPERFVEIYETLLAESMASAGNWCLTLSWPFFWRLSRAQRIAQKAKELGLYEIR
ncbi:MAG TPA: hypothetical protein VGL11_10915 [Candidatus Binatia bacterium]